MVVDVNYKSNGAKAATKEFTVRSETGSKLVIERVFKRMLQSEKEAVTEENQRGVALNDDNYSFTLVGQEKTPAGAQSTFFPSSPGPRTSSCIEVESGWTLRISR